MFSRLSLTYIFNNIFEAKSLLKLIFQLYSVFGDLVSQVVKFQSSEIMQIFILLTHLCFLMSSLCHQLQNFWKPVNRCLSIGKVFEAAEVRKVKLRHIQRHPPIPSDIRSTREHLRDFKLWTPDTNHARKEELRKWGRRRKEKKRRKSFFSEDDEAEKPASIKKQ